MPSEPLEWVIVNDFSPGIRGRVRPADITTTTQRRPGIAAPDGTYRCQALPDGSLGPLPKRTYTLVPASIPIAVANVEEGRLPISGFWADGPIQTDVEFHVAYEGALAATAKGFWYWQRIRHFSTDQVDTLKSFASTTNDHLVRTVRPTWFHNYRAHVSDQTQPGLPGVVAGWFDAGGGGDRVWHMFPDPDTPTSDTPGSIEQTQGGAAAALDPSHCFAHQGRSVVLDQNSYNHGANSYVWTHNEDIYFTESNLDYMTSLIAQTFGMENAVGYAGAISTNYSELLLLKNSGGGLFVRGDIADPTVLRVPGIPAVGNVRHTPATSPVGVVFLAGYTGAWLWNGGESAENISYDTIDGTDFIVTRQSNTPGGSDFLDYAGRIYHWYNYVIFPNNWVWDWQHQSWWRLENPSDVVLFHIGPDNPVLGTLYAAPAFLTSSSSILVYGYSIETPADDYVWTSQPLPIQEDNLFQIREIVCVCSGHGTVVVAVTDYAGATESHTFTVNSTGPTYLRDNSAAACRQLKFSITTTNAGMTPVVHEIRFGYGRDAHYETNTGP